MKFLIKNYVENINIPGLAFQYDEEGKPIGLCNAKDLIYITTAGGKIVSDEYGFGYIKELAQKFHGIKNVHYIEAEKLDIIGANVEEILQKAEEKIDKSGTCGGELSEECEGCIYLEETYEDE